MTNFAVYSSAATAVSLVLFTEADLQVVASVAHAVSVTCGVKLAVERPAAGSEYQQM